MGSYSEVTIRCEKRAFEMISEACRKENFIPDKVLKDEKLDEYTLQWEFVRWEPNIWEDKDVKAVDAVLKKLDELQDPNEKAETGEETGYGYKFIRIGEDIGDIEQRQNDWDIELYVIERADIPEVSDETGVMEITI